MLHIYGLTQTSIDDTLKEIQQAIDEQIADKVMDSDEDQEFIKKLGPEQVGILCTCQVKMVQI